MGKQQARIVVKICEAGGRSLHSPALELTPDTRVYLAGHRGLVGSALWRALERHGHKALIGRTRAELNLLDTVEVDSFYEREQPEVVIVAAARVGGIRANNDQPADFLFENLRIQNNLIDSAHRHGVRKLLFLGSSCIYPKHAEQPMREESLLTGPLEPTNQWYAVAKIAGIKLCQAYRRQHGCDFISAMPTNLYGPNDNYDPESSHVLPAMLRRFHEAKTTGAEVVTCWGSGAPLREFLHSDDLAEACLILLDRYSKEEHINVGSGHELSIKELAELSAEVTGYEGRIEWDSSKPDGTPRKLMDGTRMEALGWQPKINLREGMERAYAEYCRM